MKLPPVITLIITLVIIVLNPVTAWAFDEVAQTGQKRFKSMKTCAGCHLLQPSQTGPLKMIGANLQGADLRKLDLRQADLRRANMRGLDLRQINLMGARLKGAFMRGVDLRRANLRNASLWGVDLTGADLRRADLRGADLSQANLTKASMKGADLRGVTYCQTVMPSGKVKAPDCKWWNIETNRPRNNQSLATSMPAKAKVAPLTKHPGPRTAGAEEESILRRLFPFSVIPPADPEENFN